MDRQETNVIAKTPNEMSRVDRIKAKKGKNVTHPDLIRDRAEARLLRKRLRVLKLTEALYTPAEFYPAYKSPMSVTSLPMLIVSLQKLFKKHTKEKAP